MKKELIKIELSNDKNIHCELYPEIAPNTVNNFLKLVDMKFFDGTVFHRIIDNFMIQTGGYFLENNELVKKTVESIDGEFTSNGFQNDLKHVPGVLSMARTQNPNSASSQFFICTSECPHLDGQYAAFGKTADEESLNNAYEISHMETYNIGFGFSDFPIEPISIKTITRE